MSSLAVVIVLGTMLVVGVAALLVYERVNAKKKKPQDGFMKAVLEDAQKRPLE